MRRAVNIYQPVLAAVRDGHVAGLQPNTQLTKQPACRHIVAAAAATAVQLSAFGPVQSDELTVGRPPANAGAVGGRPFGKGGLHATRQRSSRCGCLRCRPNDCIELALALPGT